MRVRDWQDIPGEVVESGADPSGWQAVTGDESTTAELRPVIDHYLRTGPEANLLVYTGGAGRVPRGLPLRYFTTATSASRSSPLRPASTSTSEIAAAVRLFRTSVEYSSDFEVIPRYRAPNPAGCRGPGRLRRTAAGRPERAEAPLRDPPATRLRRRPGCGRTPSWPR
ncbi:hypothetical protein BRC89_08545 [Halobacteriales archaeon QS_4_70_19]|nr:MAG: hypothetical protein BRC89_08545 [Halobacteriales archaeon QS_4_70_19]